MKAALLAAGKGNRLRPATDFIPKPLLPIACSTLLEHNLLQLTQFQSIYVVVCYMKELFKGYERKYGLKLVDQGEPLGTGHAVLKLADLVRDDLLIIYSDIYLPPGFLSVMLAEKDKYDHLIAVTPVERPWEFGVIEREGPLLKRIVEKPRRGEEPSNLVVAGAFLLSQSIFDLLARLGPSPRGEVELTSALTEAASRGERIGLVEVQPWIDAGRREDFLRAQELLLMDLLSGSRRVPEGFKVEDFLILGGDASILGSRLSGPSCINAKVESSIVGPNVYLQKDSEVVRSRVRDSVVMSGSLIEGSEVLSSIISSGARILNSSMVNSITTPAIEMRDRKLTIT
ncbi:MAG: sugar phosphate nucleotidyltransferase [Candidatus Korarchaeum sp.]|nr:sugar phosphate nucleotidyltransferase [Candidatus Korarchaeum sp.]MDW8035414.1 sugar phosphate nucleotidyltransferase [Candidatus Korarchaeum sp.]